ncbi:MAG TPA: hypothetical protein VMB80_15460 [Candidatus Acidoferrum sp.]|nr:hypothetical protein [Candidatus Acidoferrum sp.]
MKTIRFMLKLAVLSAALFFSVGNASAYYDPGLQRWLNRDPREEIGFEVSNPMLRPAKPLALPDMLYIFTLNDPIHEVDVFGLWTGGPIGSPSDYQDCLQNARNFYNTCNNAVTCVASKAYSTLFDWKKDCTNGCLEKGGSWLTRGLCLSACSAAYIASEAAIAAVAAAGYTACAEGYGANVAFCGVYTGDPNPLDP